MGVGIVKPDFSKKRTRVSDKPKLVNERVIISP